MRADLIRYKDNYLDRKIIPVHLKKLIDGDESQNYTLENRDSLIVYSAEVFHHKKAVQVVGEVKRPGKYTLETNMALQDLLLQAGGFKKNAYKYNIQVFRLKNGKKQDDLVSLFDVAVTPDMLRNFDNEDDFPLEDYDMVVVRKDPEFEPHRIVKIAGEVKFPGKYPILKKNETFGDLITRAGGLSDEAFLPGLRYTRQDTLKIVGDFEKIINTGARGIVLHEKDSIYIPQHPGTVKVSGSVRNPGLVQYHENWSLERYVEAAGDYTFEAAKNKTIVYYPGGNARRKHILWNPRVKEGSEIFVPQQPEREPVDVTQLLTNWASIATSVATVIYIIGRTN
jgi:protein involved in polysaccharide export with SLBB domain